MRGYNDQLAHMADTLSQALLSVVFAFRTYGIKTAIPATSLDPATDLVEWQKIVWRAADHLAGRANVLDRDWMVGARVEAAARDWVSAADAASAYVHLGAMPWRVAEFDRSMSRVVSQLERVADESGARLM